MQHTGVSHLAKLSSSNFLSPFHHHQILHYRFEDPNSKLPSVWKGQCELQQENAEEDIVPQDNQPDEWQTLFWQLEVDLGVLEEILNRYFHYVKIYDQKAKPRNITAKICMEGTLATVTGTRDKG
jgi:hypothetical protein